MLPYHQITAAERYSLGLLRRRGLHPAAIARLLGVAATFIVVLNWWLEGGCVLSDAEVDASSRRWRRPRCGIREPRLQRRRWLPPRVATGSGNSPRSP